MNEHVNCNAVLFAYEFTPDDGYALYDDTQTENFDENGEPIHYFMRMIMSKSNAEEKSPHIWARLIEEGMEVY